MDITRPPGAAVFPAHPLDGLVNTLELAVERWQRRLRSRDRYSPYFATSSN